MSDDSRSHDTEVDPPDEQGEALRAGHMVAGRYRVVEKLGEGGMGAVYRAEHMTLDRDVAVKVLQHEVAQSEEMKERFSREAQALAALAHPHIVSVVDYGIDGSMPYLVMELLEGVSLRELLDRGPIHPVRALAIFRQIVRALAYAHARDVIHRDLKPANVFLQRLGDEGDHVKLLDFGFAKFTRGPHAAALTPGDIVMGTPSYMSPEQAMAKPVTPSADLYSAGVMLFEMLAGRVPFEGSAIEKIRQHLSARPPRLVEVAPELEPAQELEALVARTLEKDLAARFVSADELTEALDALPETAARAGMALPVPPHDSPGGTIRLGDSEVSRLRLPHRSHTLRWIAGVALLALGLVGFVFWSVSRPSPPATVAAGPVVEDRSDAGPDDAAVEVVDEMCVDAAADLLPSVRLTELSPARDLFAEGGIPETLARARTRLDAGDPLPPRQLRDLVSYARDDPEDPRGHLLIARAYVARGWKSRAVTRYRRAFEADPSARGDTSMSTDLLRFAQQGLPQSRAAHALLAVYGRESLPDIERALAVRAPDAPASVRLRRLRGAIGCALVRTGS